MVPFSFSRWLRMVFGPQIDPGRKNKVRYCTNFETLEERMVPANIYVTGFADSTTITAPTAVTGGFKVPNLRSAVDFANNHAGDDVILLKNGTYAVDQGELFTSDNYGGDLEIRNRTKGGLPVLDANFQNRVLHNGFNRILTLTNIVVQHGQDTYGGGVLSEGEGTLALQNSKVVDNLAQSDSPYEEAFGGGIYIEYGGHLEMTRSVVARNVASGFDGSDPYGGSDAEGGGIYLSLNASLAMTESTVEDNEALGGDGTPQENAGDAEGGGLYLEGAFNSPNVSITRSTFSGNVARGGSIGAEGGHSTNFAGTARGGAIYKGTIGISTDNLNMDIVNSTFNDNLAQGGDDHSNPSFHQYHPGLADGGALYLRTETNGVVSLTNDTIAGNTANGGDTPGGNSATSYGGGVSRGVIGYGGVVQVFNTILTNNIADVDKDVHSAFDSKGNNIIGSIGGATGFGADDFDGHDGDINLGPLGFYNGGKTKTMPLLSGSFAIDKGNNDVLTSPYLIDEDQNGGPRRTGWFVDVGAVEFKQKIINLNRTYVMRTNHTLDVSAANGLLKGATLSNLTVELVGSPPPGTFDLKSDGSFTYTPPTDFKGTVSFRFKVKHNGDDLFMSFTAKIRVINNYRIGPV